MNTPRPKESTLVEKGKRGEYELVEPIDTMILRLLPEQGALFGGLYPLGETVMNLSRKLSDGKDVKVPSSVVTTRLRTLGLQGLTEKTKSVTSGSGSTVWQRTAAATKLLNEKGSANGKQG